MISTVTSPSKRQQLNPAHCHSHVPILLFFCWGLHLAFQSSGIVLLQSNFTLAPAASGLYQLLVKNSQANEREWGERGNSFPPRLLPTITDTVIANPVTTYKFLSLIQTCYKKQVHVSHTLRNWFTSDPSPANNFSSSTSRQGHSPKLRLQTVCVITGTTRPTAAQALSESCTPWPTSARFTALFVRCSFVS